MCIRDSHLPGAEHAVDAADVLNGKVKVGNKVVMLGVGLVGSETALWLAENGHDVTLVGRGPQIMKGVASTDALADVYKRQARYSDYADAANYVYTICVKNSDLARAKELLGL